LRVLYLSTNERGGPIAHLRSLVPEVMAAGVDALVVCQTDQVAGMFASIGVPARVLPIRSKTDVGGALRVAPEIGLADLVHTHDRRAGLFGRTLGWIRRTPVVHTLHGLPERFAPHVGQADGMRTPSSSTGLRAEAWLERCYVGVESALASAGVVVTPSDAMARYLIRRGFPRRRLRVIHSGIDVRRTAPSGQHRPPRIGTATNLEWWKGVDVLLFACAQLEFPAHVDVYGDGADRPKLERLAETLGVDATFYGHVDDVRDRLEELNLFVLPSRGENFPIALLEAMAAALPVVATTVGGVPEIVDDGTTGLLVPPDDPGAMAAAIGDVLARPSAAESFGRAGARRVLDRFDAREAAREVVRLYEDVCASST
jgi:glycosyltransferase involved in cell wall biosynthesis